MSLNEIKIKVSKEFSKFRKDCYLKECLFPDKSGCSKKIIKGHSIQKSKILTQIAENGYVVSSDMLSTFVSEEFEKVGINSASTFFGFCGYHDSIIFSEIENKNFNATIEQNFLHAYRACAIELVKKKVACCVYEKLIKANPDNPFLPYFKSQLFGFQWGVKDLTYILGKFSHELLKRKENRNYNIVYTINKELAYESLIAVNSFFTLEYDFEGRLIIDLRDTNLVPAKIFLNIFPQKGKTFILFSCLTENLDIYKEIFSKISKFHESRLEIFFSNMVISHCENFFVNPSKYYKIPKKMRKLVVNHFLNTMMDMTPDNITRGSINLFKTFKR